MISPPNGGREQDAGSLGVRRVLVVAGVQKPAQDRPFADGLAN